VGLIGFAKEGSTKNGAIFANQNETGKPDFEFG